MREPRYPLSYADQPYINIHHAWYLNKKNPASSFSLGRHKGTSLIRDRLRQNATLNVVVTDHCIRTSRSVQDPIKNNAFLDWPRTMLGFPEKMSPNTTEIITKALFGIVQTDLLPPVFQQRALFV